MRNKPKAMKYEHYVEVRYSGERSESKDRKIRGVADSFRGGVKYVGEFQWRVRIKRGKGWTEHRVFFFTEHEADGFKSEIERHPEFKTSAIMWPYAEPKDTAKRGLEVSTVRTSEPKLPRRKPPRITPRTPRLRR